MAQAKAQDLLTMRMLIAIRFNEALGREEFRSRDPRLTDELCQDYCKRIDQNPTAHVEPTIESLVELVNFMKGLDRDFLNRLRVIPSRPAYSDQQDDE